MTIIYVYSAYALASLVLTIFLARTLFKHGRGTLSTLFTAERCDGTCGLETTHRSPDQGAYR